MVLELAALHAALGLAANPSLVDQARLAAFPTGTALLLEIAAGDKDAMKRCAENTNVSEDQIRAASEFYIEQVLLSERHDSYRTLGADQSASPATLRRNMALLMRWLHPDTAAHTAHRAQIDRTVFAERVAAAWEDLKNDERRASYDAQSAQAAIERTKSTNIRPGIRLRSKQPSKGASRVQQHKPNKGLVRSSLVKKRNGSRKLKVVPMLKDTWISRVLNVFRKIR